MSGRNPTMEQRVAALETQVADHEKRLTVLEGGGTTPVPPDPPATGDSPDGTTIHPESGSIIDAKGDTWTIDRSKVLCINGYQDGFTPPVSVAYYTGHVLYFMRENGAWFKATGGQPAWTGTSDPTGGTVPPNPNPPSGTVGDQTGTQARRLTDVFDFFGANCFPNGQDGAGPSAGPDAHAAGIKAIWSGTGFMPVMRLYAQVHVGAPPLIDWCEKVNAQYPDCHFTICATDPASADVVVDVMRAGAGKWIATVEGINEPNNTEHLGGVPTSPQDCLAAQQKIYNAAKGVGVHVMSPSCADLIGDPQFIQKYFGDTLPDIIAASDIANIHNYPNSFSPQHELQARTQGISQTFGGKPPATSEFHPLLFNRTSDEHLGALYTAFAKLSGEIDWKQSILTWYCMWDYANAFDKPVGLFRNFSPTNLRPSAELMSTLMKVCGDVGLTSRSFDPGKLDVTVGGLPSGFNDKAGGRFAVLQGSDGTFLMPVWNEQDAFSSTQSQVTVKFNAGAKSKITRYSFANPITANPSVQNWSNVDQVNFALKTPDLQVLKVTM